jgi:hypothetical protein
MDEPLIDRIGEKILAAADRIVTPRSISAPAPPGGPAPPGDRRPWARRHPVLTVLIGAGALAVIFATALSTQSPGTASQQPAGAQTVTYIVNGDPANVTYGLAGSQLQGASPMTFSDSLGNAAYYAINAQLQGDGSVTCEIDVNGQAVSSSTADGGYHIASCEIMRDPASGNWVDANSG